MKDPLRSHVPTPEPHKPSPSGRALSVALFVVGGGLLAVAGFLMLAFSRYASAMWQLSSIIGLPGVVLIAWGVLNLVRTRRGA